MQAKNKVCDSFRKLADEQLPLALRPVLESLMRRYNLSPRSSEFIVSDRRPSLPILSFPKHDSRLYSQATVSATDVVSYTRQRRPPILTITSIPQYTPSQSSSASDHLPSPSPISIKRALQLPGTPSLPPPRRDSPIMASTASRASSPNQLEPRSSIVNFSNPRFTTSSFLTRDPEHPRHATVILSNPRPTPSTCNPKQSNQFQTRSRTTRHTRSDASTPAPILTT